MTEGTAPVKVNRTGTWPSAGRIIHIEQGGDDSAPPCRAAIIVRLVEPTGPDADFEFFPFPSETLDVLEGPLLGSNYDWHWPEYVGPIAE
jgi:hypothetical protein